jgi:hypothetical protein
MQHGGSKQTRWTQWQRTPLRSQSPIFQQNLIRTLLQQKEIRNNSQRIESETPRPALHRLTACSIKRRITSPSSLPVDRRGRGRRRGRGLPPRQAAYLLRTLTGRARVLPGLSRDIGQTRPGGTELQVPC